MKAKGYLGRLILFLVAIIFGSFIWHLIRFSYLVEVEIRKDAPVYKNQLKSLSNFTYPLHLLGTNDYNLLVNYRFQFSILNLGCKENTFLLVLIHSTTSNFKKRSVIRDTWGNKMEDVEFYFVLGKSANDSIQEKLEEESQLHHDIIQGNFLDTYRNLTYKHVMGLKYAIYHCSRAKYILKTDDDVFVNMPLLKRFLLHNLSPNGTSDLLYCPVAEYVNVLRSYRSKWRVSFKEYPFRTYPTYCLGWVILYSPDIIFKLYKAAQATSELFWIDDVYVTGILASKNNITHTDNKEMIISKEAQDELVNKSALPYKPFLFGQPNLKESEIRNMWIKIASSQDIS